MLKLKNEVVKNNKNGIKKPIFKKWWFWVIVVVILAAIFGNTETKDAINSAEQQTEEKQNKSTAIDDIDFYISGAHNDTTNLIRVSTIAKQVVISDYAIEYYEKYFDNDDEIHVIVNFNYKTTTKISVTGNLLNVSVYEYVDKEEHDAKLLFSGMLLQEIWLDKNTGEQIKFA